MVQILFTISKLQKFQCTILSSVFGQFKILNRLFRESSLNTVSVRKGISNISILEYFMVDRIL